VLKEGNLQDFWKTKSDWYWQCEKFFYWQCDQKFSFSFILYIIDIENLL